MEIKLKSAWDKLSMLEKALLIKLSVDNGVSSLKLIRDTYNLYANGGKKSSAVDRPRDIDEAIYISRNTPYNKNIDDVEGPGYREYMWKLAQAKSKVWGISPEEAYESFIHPSEFNYRRWYNLASQDELDNALTNGDAHWMDVFGKTVGADTFSNESPYSGYSNPYNPKGITGGTWTGRLGIDEYIPSESQIDNDWPLNKAWFAIDRGNKYYQEKISKGEDTHEVPSIMTYNNGVMLPEITVTPRGNYIEYSPYANGGNLVHKKSGKEYGESSWLNNGYKSSNDWLLLMKMNANQMLQNLLNSPFYMTNLEMLNLEFARMQEAIGSNSSSEAITYTGFDNNGNEITKRLPAAKGLNTMWDAGIIDYMPVLGDGKLMLDLIGATKNNDYLTAGLLGGMMFIPNIIEKPLKSLKTYVKNATNRALESVLRIGDEFADNPFTFARLMLGNKGSGLKYVFTGLPQLAYLMPYRYSGQVLWSPDNTVAESAHIGDLIDVIMGKSNVLLDEYGNTLGRLTDDITNIPDKTIAAFQSLPGRSDVLPKVLKFDLPTLFPEFIPKQDIQLLINTPLNIPMEIGRRTKPRVPILLGGRTVSIVDPGHYGLTALKTDNGLQLFGHDVYHYTPKNAKQTNFSASWMPNIPITIGNPFVVEWQVPELIYDASRSNSLSLLLLLPYSNVKPSNVKHLFNIKEFVANKTSKLSTGGPLYPNTYDNIKVHYTNGGNLVHKKSGEELEENLDLNYIQQRDDFKGNFITKLVPTLWGRHGDLSRYYFGQPTKDNALVYSLFKPSKSNNPSAKYIAIALPEFKDYIVDAYFNHPEYFVDDKHYNGNFYSSFVNKNHKLNNYDLNNLGTFTLGKGRDERGDYLSYYDIWDTDTSKQSNPDFQKEYWGAAKPFEVYDRIYLDDYYKVPNTEKGTIFLPEIIVTPNTNKKSTGGPLYPFSFEKNPFLKTPVVRYDEGGHLYGFGDWLTNLFSPSDTTTTTVNTEPAPLDLGELATRQAYAESRFDSNAVSPANAVGLFLVTPNTLAYYNSKTGNAFTTQDLYDDTINQLVRDWYMNDLMNRPWNTKNNPSDSVQYAKSLGAYNWGPTNLVNTLNKAKADGVDIYNSWDWLAYLPTETRDYINFVLRNLNNSAHRNNIMYNRSTDKYLSKVSAIKSNK